MRWVVRAPTFLGHSNFEVNIFLEFFNLQSTVDTEFFHRGVWAPNFFGYTKFEVKKFLEFFPLLNALDSEFVRGRGVQAPTILVMVNLISKIFWNLLIYRALWMLNVSQMVWAPTFFHHREFEVKIFSEFFPLPSALDWIFQSGVCANFLLVMPNLRSKNFQNFFLYQALWTLNLLGEGAPGTNYFWSHQNWG